MSEIEGILERLSIEIKKEISKSNKRSGPKNTQKGTIDLETSKVNYKINFKKKKWLVLVQEDKRK